MTSVLHGSTTRLDRSAWRALAAEHTTRARALTAGHEERRRVGADHPVEDFLWTYYTLKPAHLHRWHPGPGVVLEGAARDESTVPPRREWRFYRREGDDLAVDTGRYVSERGAATLYIERLLRATAGRPARFGCFGLHEWAMVYRQQPGQVRHAGLPLRMPATEIDSVVEANRIACTHVDAFRFFTPEAVPLNSEQPTRENQVDLEQPGCLHAGMDLYKWAGKLGPIVPGDLLLDAFVLARDIREVDMQASPYDVSAYEGASGRPLVPIAIETAEGKREYVRRQREFTDRANVMRERLLAAIAALPVGH